MDSIFFPTFEDFLPGPQLSQYRQLRYLIEKKQYLLIGLVALFWLLSAFRDEKSRKKHRPDLTLNKRVILGGNNLIFILKKSPER